MSQRNLFVRFFASLWAGVDGIRKILHLVVLLFVFLLFFGLTADEPVVLPTSGALYVEPHGFLVEQLDGDPYDRAIAELLGDGRPQTRVQDIVDVFFYFKVDA